MVEFNSPQMFNDLTKRKDIITDARVVVKAIEEKNAELAALQNKLQKLDEKVKGYVATKFRPLLGDTEDTREVLLSNGHVILVIYDKVEEYRLQTLEAKAKADEAQAGKKPEVKTEGKKK